MDSGNELMGRTLKAQRDRLRKVTVGCLVRGRSYAITECLSTSITDHAFGSTRRGVPRCQGAKLTASPRAALNPLTTWDDIGGFKFAFQCRPGFLREAVTVPAQLYRHNRTRHPDISGSREQQPARAASNAKQSAKPRPGAMTQKGSREWRHYASNCFGVG
jgi:hypothetical protein